MKKFKINYADLVKSENYAKDGSLDTEKALLTYQWMVSSAVSQKGIYEMLSGRPTSIGYTCVRPFDHDWKAELGRRFAAIFLSPHLTMEAVTWKVANGIDLSGSRMIQACYYGPERPDWLAPLTVEAYLTRLLTIRGRLAHSLNPRHPAARVVKNVRLLVRPEFRLMMAYGLDDERPLSWGFELARQGQGEPLLDFLKRAQEILKQELEPYPVTEQEVQPVI